MPRQPQLLRSSTCLRAHPSPYKRSSQQPFIRRRLRKLPFLGPSQPAPKQLYRLRRRIAYISPQQVLLHLISLAENIALGPCYYQGCEEAEALAPHAGLLAQLELTAHLTQNPPQVSNAVYGRAVWARELVKGPELILAVISGEFTTTAGAAMLASVLREYRTRYGVAVLLLGESLEAFYPLGHQLFLLLLVHP